MRTTGPAAPPTQPSSAAAAELLIAERSASLIISRFNASDDSYLRLPGHRPQPTGAENLAASKHYGFVCPKFARHRLLRPPARCATRQIAAPRSGAAGDAAAGHFAAMLSRVGQGRRSAGTSDGWCML